MAELGIIAILIYFVVFLILLILGILLPVFVFRIYQESIKTNKLLEKLISCVLDPKEAAKTIQNPEKIRQLQKSYRGRKNKGNDKLVESEIVNSIINGKDKSEKIALCSCGKRFSYPIKDVGSKGCCPRCKGEFILP